MWCISGHRRFGLFLDEFSYEYSSFTAIHLHPTHHGKCSMLSIALVSLLFDCHPAAGVCVPFVNGWRSATVFFGIACSRVGRKTSMCVCMQVCMCACVCAWTSDKMGESEINRTFEVIWINWFCKWTRLKTYFDFAFISFHKLNFHRMHACDWMSTPSPLLLPPQPIPYTWHSNFVWVLVRIEIETMYRNTNCGERMDSGHTFSHCPSTLPPFTVGYRHIDE